MESKKDNKIKIVSSVVLSMLMMFSITLTIMVSFFKFTVVNPNTYLNILESKEIYNRIYDTIQGNMAYALTVNNISNDVKENVISLEEVKTEVSNIVRETGLYFKTGENNIKPVNTEIYSERFNSNLKEFIKDNSIHINSELEEHLKALEDDVAFIINNELQIINVDTVVKSSTVNKVITLINLYTNKVLLLLIIVSIVLALSLILIWKKNFVESTRWIGNSFISAGALITIVFFSGYISKFYGNIVINIEYIRNFIGFIIKHFLLVLTNYGVVSIIIGLLLLIPQIKYSIKRSKMVRKRRRVVDVNNI